MTAPLTIHAKKHFLCVFCVLFKRFGFLDVKDLGQRAEKLPAVKVGGLKKSLPAGPGPSQPVCPGSNPGHGPIILKV